MKNTPAELAQRQLDAYNQGNIEEFLAVYHKDVVVREFPSGAIMYEGIQAMEKRYSELFKSNPNQHADLRARLVKGNTVIDHEYVTGRANGIEVEAIAMYEVTDDCIVNVWFVK